MANENELLERIAQLEKQLAEKNMENYAPTVIDVVKNTVSKAVEKISKAVDSELKFQNDLDGEIEKAIKEDEKNVVLKEPVENYKKTVKSYVDDLFDYGKERSPKLFDDAKNALWRYSKTEKMMNVMDSVMDEVGLICEDYANDINEKILDFNEKLIVAKENLIEKFKDLQITHNLDVRIIDPLSQMIKENVWALEKKCEPLKEQIKAFAINTKAKAESIIANNRSYVIKFDYDEITNQPMHEDPQREDYSKTSTLTLRHEMSHAVDRRIEEDTLALKGAMDYVRANYPLAYEKIAGDIAKFNFDKSVDVSVNAYHSVETGVDCIGVSVANGAGATLSTIYDIRSMEVTDIVYQKSSESEPREVFNKESGFVNYNLMLNGYSKELISKYEKASETLSSTIQNDGKVEQTSTRTSEQTTEVDREDAE